jgi:pilus assembly protein CpaB
MKAARILVLAVALAAGGAAAFLIGSDEEKKPEAPPVAQVETTGVLIAKNDIGMGTAISSQDLQWQAWPSATTGERYTVRFGVSNK